jgi:hypothetical protein
VAYGPQGPRCAAAWEGVERHVPPGRPGELPDGGLFVIAGHWSRFQGGIAGSSRWRGRRSGT